MPPRRLRFAFSSCQQINDSHYVAHLAMADEDIDFWVHYGDYIYVHDFATLTLADYRQVYRRFKANPLLQELHARYPVVAMWDDGEFVNGIDRTLEPARFAAAKQAWFDYQPVMRRRGDPDRTYREITWGDLASFLLLDVRQYRDPWPPGAPGGPLGLSTVDTRTETGAHLFDADRTCLGHRQKSWLKRAAARAEPRWRHIGHAYNFLALRLEDFDTPEARANPPAGFHVNGGSYIASDAWDAYWAERRELLTFLDQHEVPNVVVTAGHTHIYFARRAAPRPRRPRCIAGGRPRVRVRLAHGRPRPPAPVSARPAPRRGRGGAARSRGPVPRRQPAHRLHGPREPGLRTGRADAVGRHRLVPGDRHVRPAGPGDDAGRLDGAGGPAPAPAAPGGAVPPTGRGAPPDQVPSGPSHLESDGSSDSFDSSKEARRPTWGCSTARSRSSPAQGTASAGVTPWSWPSTAPRSWSTTSARRSPARAPATTPTSPCKLIEARGGEAVANYEDVADYEGAGRMVAQAVDTWGRLDVLVNNAGIVRDARHLEHDRGRLRRGASGSTSRAPGRRATRPPATGASAPRRARPSPAGSSTPPRAPAWSATSGRPTTPPPRPPSPASPRRSASSSTGSA